jgi:hypothetical protein
MSHPSNGTDICKAHFTYNGRRFQVTQFRGGRLEVYRIEQNGLEMFEGYVGDLRDLDLAEAAYDAFQGAPGQRWLFDAASERFLMLSDGRWA